MEQRYNYSNYLIRKKVFKFLGNAFHIYAPDGSVLFYAKLKAFKLKEDIRLYTDENMGTECLKITARRALDISATYDVYDSQKNEKVGALKRQGLRSILRDEWLILDNNDVQVGMIQEDSQLFAMMRRVLSNLIPQEFHGFIKDKVVLQFKQQFNPFVSKIDLDFSMDGEKLLDRRLGLAAAVLLCAIEGRQS